MRLAIGGWDSDELQLPVSRSRSIRISRTGLIDWQIAQFGKNNTNSKFVDNSVQFIDIE